jgi:hypothetical protein
MFSATVVSKRIVSWVTRPIWRLSDESVASRRSTPSKETRPAVGA